MKKLILITLLLLPFLLKGADSKLSGLPEADLTSVGPTSKVYILTNTPLGSAWISPSNFLDLLKTFDNWTAQFYSDVLSNLVGTVGKNVTNLVSLSTTNGTSKPLTNSYANGTVNLYGLEAGSGLLLSMNPSNIVPLLDWAQAASTTNVIGLSNWVNSVSNYVTASTNSMSVTGWVNFRQPADTDLTNWSNIPTGEMANVVSTTFLTNFLNSVSNLAQTKQTGSVVLSNLVGTVARNVTNVVSLSTTNATSKPITNSYANGVLSLYGVEAGSNTLVTVNPSNLVVNAPYPGNSNVVYVQRDQNLSNILANAVSGTTYVIDTGTNQTRGKVPTVTADLGLSELRLSNVNNVMLIGNGNTVIHNTNDGIGFGIYNCSNVTIRNITFKGTRTNNTYNTGGLIAHGLVQAYATNYNVFFDGVTVADCNFFGINMSAESVGSVYTSRNYNSRVDYCNFISCGYTNMTGVVNPDGGGLQCFPDVIVDHSIFLKCGRGLETFHSLEVSSLTVRNTLFRGIWGRTIMALSFAGGNKLLVDNCIFEPDNNARQDSATHILLGTSSSGLVCNNVFTNIAIPNDYAIYVGPTVGNTRNLDIVNNVFENVHDAITVQDTVGYRIHGNRFVFITNATIFAGGTDGIISDNTMLNCGQGGTPPIFMLAGAGTNQHIRNNLLTFNSGIAPSSFINLGANQIETIISMNFIRDSGGTITVLSDSGVRTRCYNAFHNSGNPITMNASTNYTVLLTDAVIGATNATMTAGARVITLPNANQIPGRTLTIFDPGRTALGSNVTINTVAGQLFNGLTGLTSTNIAQDGAAISIFSANGGWTIFEDSKEIVAFETYGGLNFPRWTGGSNVFLNTQPSLAHEMTYWLTTFTGAILGSQGVAPVTNGGTTITHSVPSESQSHMVVLSTPATSNGTASAWSSTDIANSGSHNGSSKVAGYFYAATWCSTNLIGQVIGGGGPRTFVGLTSIATESYTNIVVTTNATGPYIGLMVDTKQTTNMFITARDAGNEFRTNTGIPFIATNIYKFYLFNAPTSRFVGWRLDDTFAGTSAFGVFSNAVPTNFMKFGIMTRNGTNRAHDVRFSRLYLQAPLGTVR